MNSSISTPVSATSESSRDSASNHGMPGWLREPLLHFIVLGGLLFAIDHYLVVRKDDPHTIVVGPDVDAEAISVFEQSRGRKPNEAELTALHQVWLDNEVLYREGLAMQVDKGDDVMRERVIFKALSMIEAGVKLPPIDDKKLREWFEQHRAKYDEPKRYNFQEAVLTGAASEEAVRGFVSQLNNGTPGDAQAGLRVFKDRPYDNLVQSYGADFPKLLEEAQPGAWQAVQAGNTWHAIKVDAVIAARPADFEILRGVVLQDWKDATASEQRTAAVRQLAKKYKVQFGERAHGSN